MTSQTEKEAAEAAERIQSLETELIKAHSEAATARQSLEEQLKTKQKEVTDTKAKLRRTVRTKYSFRTLSSDFVAWFNKKWERL
jgi:septal ring factor EnvC (AmiA/AmiB activator)